MTQVIAIGKAFEETVRAMKLVRQEIKETSLY